MLKLRYLHLVRNFDELNFYYSSWCSGERFQKLNSRINASFTRQPLVKGERLVRSVMNAAMITTDVKKDDGLQKSDKANFHTRTRGPEAEQKLRSGHKDQTDGNWSSFQLANSTPPQSVIDCAIAPSARMSVPRRS